VQFRVTKVQPSGCHRVCRGFGDRNALRYIFSVLNKHDIITILISVFVISASVTHPLLNRCCLHIIHRIPFKCRPISE